RHHLTGPAFLPTLDTQVLATALAVYVTNEGLAGTAASSYGFLVTPHGGGGRAGDLGPAGPALGVGGGAHPAVINLLHAVDARSHGGLVYDLDGDGDSTSLQEAASRTLASLVFLYINQAGGI